MNGSASRSDGLRVVHEARRFVVVDKPAGMLSVPGKTEPDCAAARVAAMYPDATGPMVCHRLDQATSGLLVLALDAEAQRFISLQFQRRRVEKVYEALVWGVPEAREGRVELPLRTDWPNRPRQMVDFERGKRAVTEWRVLEETEIGGEPASRLEMRPITGKTHQLRVHAADARGIGRPMVGDEIYGRAAERLMLHARELVLTDPETLRRVRVGSVVAF